MPPGTWLPAAPRWTVRSGYRAARPAYLSRPGLVTVQLLVCDELAGGIHKGLPGLRFDGYLDHWRTVATWGVQVHRVRGGNTTSMLSPHAFLGTVVGRLLAGG